eukprot:gnl/TRDRNA2_/TRDRNA2_153896_c0_seq1.p1 gnl/TRDRNA2_/TRDRNA2_153896_c0~~gnl/TRDRNA2_/TRDRNA2_153896_c0_seq1.p1  ORF type:complete len:238 (+),score=47.31 gnl/TRDRNA2_/TRDRNA2_153896_c0_seq1:87-800(+)
MQSKAMSAERMSELSVLDAEQGHVSRAYVRAFHSELPDVASLLDLTGDGDRMATDVGKDSVDGCDGCKGGDDDDNGPFRGDTEPPQGPLWKKEQAMHVQVLSGSITKHIELLIKDMHMQLFQGLQDIRKDMAESLSDLRLAANSMRHDKTEAAPQLQELEEVRNRVFQPSKAPSYLDAVVPSTQGHHEGSSTAAAPVAPEPYTILPHSPFFNPPPPSNPAPTVETFDPKKRSCCIRS